METILFFVGLCFIGWLIGSVLNAFHRAKLYDELRPRYNELAAKEPALTRRAEHLAALESLHETKVKVDREAVAAIAKANDEAIRILAAQKARGFPWLADAYADYFHLQEAKAAQQLERKKHPARKAADRLRQTSEKRREAERLWRTYRYQLACYESLFPWLTEFREIDDDSVLLAPTASATPETQTDSQDPAAKYLSAGEYENLPAAERFQKALDRYWASRKTTWQIGRDYERYVGYLYEKDGWDVTYFGILKGLEDLGRDLLVQKDGRMMVVQCKCWAAYKTIHEKHVFQLFGTTIEHWVTSGLRQNTTKTVLFEDAIRQNPIRPVLYTSTSLSEQAHRFARVLGVEVHENTPLEPYPCIKCNFTKANGKIYHLPFDQQYDRTKIQDPRTERFVATVKEAEALGYRRAFRWHGSR